MKLIAVLMICAGCAWGQDKPKDTVTIACPISSALVTINPIKPPDTPCDKFQYSAVTVDLSGYKEVCFETPHEVTEREWQEILGRLNDLERPSATSVISSNTAWPTVASVQLILDSEQAKLPGNEHIKPCGPKNHDDACVDASRPHITNHLYIEKGHCEQREGVKCTVDGQYFAPIGRPVFEESHREVKGKADAK